MIETDDACGTDKKRLLCSSGNPCRRGDGGQFPTRTVTMLVILRWPNRASNAGREGRDGAGAPE